MSGHTQHVITHNDILDEGCCIIANPFPVIELKKKLVEILADYVPGIVL